MSPTPEPLSLAAFVPGTAVHVRDDDRADRPGCSPDDVQRTTAPGKGEALRFDVVAEREESLAHDRPGLALVPPAGRPRADGGDLARPRLRAGAQAGRRGRRPCERGKGRRDHDPDEQTAHRGAW